MQTVKKYLGVVWMLIGVASIALLIYSAAANIGTAEGDIGRPIPWVIIIAVFTPIAIGLVVFGWYSLNGEYTSPPTSLRQSRRGGPPPNL